MRKKLAVVTEQQPVLEKPSLMNPRFIYTKGSNVQATWRKYGWVPPTEYREDYEFKKNREGA